LECAYFSPSWTALQSELGRDFSLIALAATSRYPSAAAKNTSLVFAADFDWTVAQTLSDEERSQATLPVLKKKFLFFQNLKSTSL
jgi:hypothetical protein